MRQRTKRSAPPRTVPGMSATTAARGLRGSVERAGGAMRISVPALGDAFGRGKMTARARTAIEQVLDRQGLEVTPSLVEAGEGWVTLRLAADRVVPAPRVATTPAEVAAAAARRMRESQLVAALRPRIPASLRVPAAVATTGFLIPGLLVAAFALATQPDAPEPRPVTPAEQALRNGDFRAAVRATPAREVAAMRARIARRLVAEGRVALRDGAYVRAIQRARRAARYGEAPGAAGVVVSGRAGLDLRRERLRRLRGERRGRR